MFVGYYPVGLAYDPVRNEIFVANSADDTVSVMSDSTYEVVATIPVGNQPVGVTYDSVKNQVYITNLADNSVSVISNSSYQVAATVSVGAKPVGITYDTGTGELYVTNNGDNTVSVISDSNITSASPSQNLFSEAIPILLLVTVIVAVLCTVFLALKKRRLIGGAEGRV